MNIKMKERWNVAIRRGEECQEAMKELLDNLDRKEDEQ